MKNVLIIAYHFPPARSAGIYRPVKFAKYFPEFGWNPVILAVKNPDSKITDASLLKELPPNTKIYLSYSLELIRFENWVYERIYGRRQAQSPPPRADIKAASAQAAAPIRQSPLKRLFLTPLRSFIHNVINTPDGMVGWIPFAVVKGLYIIWREKIDVIFSTSPPESGHVIALILSRLTRKRLVVDFRDPWTTHDNRQNLSASAAWAPRMSKSRIRYERWLERKTLQRAGAIIHTGNGRAQLVKSAFPSINSDKHHVITNGYDEADFADLALPSNRASDPCLNIFSVGEIYMDSAIENFLMALERIFRAPSSGREIKVTFVSESVEMWKDKLSRPPFAGNVSVLGFRPHKEAVRMMTEADVLLLLLPSGSEVMRDRVIAGRTFEYMRAARPILMVGWEGESSRILEAGGLLTFISHDDIALMEKVILNFHTMKVAGDLNKAPNWEFLRQFDRRLQTGKLAGLMDGLVAE